MGCAKSKLPCSESSRDDKLKEILGQKNLLYSPGSPSKEQQQQLQQQQIAYENYVAQRQQNEFNHQQNVQSCYQSPYTYQPPQHQQQHQQLQDSSPNNRSTGVRTCDEENFHDRPISPSSASAYRRQAENVFARISGRIRRPKRYGNDRFDPRVTCKYEIKALIGKGSFSRVVRVEHKATRYPFAMKLMPAKNGTGPFENELSILSRVDHKHVVRLIEIFRTDTRVYVVMELATGGELYDRIVAKGRFSETETAVCVKMILDGLAYLHQSGITHRDLKPENLLYYQPGADSKILITDFGLAHQGPPLPDGREPTEKHLMNDPCGTPEYIAPEILARVPYTNKVDMWALGVITFILLSGSMPFDDENRTVLYSHILRCRYHFYPELWCDVSDEAQQFVGALLTLYPQWRLSAEQALQHSWLAALTGRNVEVNVAQQRRHVHKSFSAHGDCAGRGRSRSTRSIRSVARSDAGHRVDRAEVERLHQDPEIRRILFEASRNHQMLQQQQQQQQQQPPGGQKRDRRPPSPPPPAPSSSQLKKYHLVNVGSTSSSHPLQQQQQQQALNGGVQQTSLITTTNYGVV